MRLAPLLLVLLVACGGGSTPGEEPRGCTLIACFTGLSVVLTNRPAGPYRVEAIGPGEATPHAQDCSGAGQCSFGPQIVTPPADQVFFANYQPVTVTISVITAAGSSTYDKTPAYTTSFPNGPDCGACRSAVITIP